MFIRTILSKIDRKFFIHYSEFWALYQHLKLPQHLSQGCDYLVFRSGVEPYWESEHNKNGGRWNLEIKKAQRNEQLNDKWLNTLLALIGEQLRKSFKFIVYIKIL